MTGILPSDRHSSVPLVYCYWIIHVIGFGYIGFGFGLGCDFGRCFGLDLGHDDIDGP